MSFIAYLGTILKALFQPNSDEIGKWALHFRKPGKKKLVERHRALFCYVTKFDKKFTFLYHNKSTRLLVEVTKSH